jgi:hypothetical protein
MKLKSPAEFKATMTQAAPPDGLSAYENALWYAGKGDWDKAHQIVQDMDDKPSARIHAFLHRKEGDLSNARYWYEIAGASMPTIGLDAEWEELVAQFIGV